MGQGGSTEFKEAFDTTVSQLSELQLAEIGSRYNDLYKQAGGERGKIIDRERFAEYFKLPVALGDRLFEAFDKKQNGSIDFEEFVCGLAIVTNGTFNDKCQLLFTVFNLAKDEGVSREELYSLIYSVVTSTNTILLTLTEGGNKRSGSPINDPEKAVKSIVDTAFRNCDISRSGKLLPLEFEYWLKRNPKMLDYLLPSIEDPEESATPTLASLLFVPNEQVESDEMLNTKIGEEDLASIQLENEDGIINGEQGVVNEEGVVKEEGVVNEKVVDSEEGVVKKEDIVNEEGVTTNKGVVKEKDAATKEGMAANEGVATDEDVIEEVVVNGKESPSPIEEAQEEGAEEDIKESGTIEPPPSPTGTPPDEGQEDDVKEEVMEEQIDGRRKQKQSADENVTTETTPKPLTLPSPTDETIKLARALSESIVSPVVEEAPSLVPTNDNVTVKVPDRVLSAWLPNPAVEAMLASGRKVSPDYLTQPGLKYHTTESDPIAEVIKSTFPGETTRRQQVSVDQVKLDEEGLHILIQNGCYHGALMLTSQFLSAHGQGVGQAGRMAMHTHKTLQMWYVRLALLHFLERYNEVEDEFRAFRELDQPDLYYQYDKRQYPDIIGSMVPFPMRLLYAQLPLSLNNPQLALNRVCLLQNTTVNILNMVRNGRLPLNEEELSTEERGVAEEVWLSRLVHVKLALCRCLMETGDYFLVKTTLEEISEMDLKHRNETLSALGRLSLLYGDIVSADNYFTSVAASSLDQDTIQNRINRSFIDLFRNQWGIAEQGFHAASKMDSCRSLNNSTVCTVYQENLSEAIAQLEDNIKTTPTNNLNPSLFFTLFSYYDLESSRSQAKKLSWLPYLGQHAPEGFNLAALGLTA